MTEDPKATIDIGSITVQIVTAGGFGVLVMFLITKHIPSLIKDFRDDIRSTRESFERKLDLKDEAYRTDIQKDRVAFQETLVKIEDSHRNELTEHARVTRELIDMAKRGQP